MGRRRERITLRRDHPKLRSPLPLGSTLPQRSSANRTEGARRVVAGASGSRSWSRKQSSSPRAEVGRAAASSHFTPEGVRAMARQMRPVGVKCVASVASCRKLLPLGCSLFRCAMGFSTRASLFGHVACLRHAACWNAKNHGPLARGRSHASHRNCLSRRSTPR